MNELSDQQLLREYTETQSEAAFAELVRRHIDLVYSAALRMVCDSHLAQDVTQNTFVALAQNTRQLTDRPVLSGWLHRTAQNLASKVVRSDVRRRAWEQEAALMNDLLSNPADAGWEPIAPHLDTALGELSEPDRDAVLLRYFEKKSAQEMAERLGISDEAAQKRVSRAVERLREFFAKRGVTVGASGLAVVISANAIQAAPVGLAVTIFTAAALAGTTIATTATATAIKTIAMTTLQKSLMTAVVAAAVGAGIYEARQASNLRNQVQTLLQQRSPLTDQLQQLLREHDDATNQLAAMKGENARLKSGQNTTALLKLRGEVARLSGDSRELAQLKASAAQRKGQLPDAETQEFVPRESWAFAGYGTPEATVQSLLWSLREGDTNALQAFLNGFTPETRKELEKASQSIGFSGFDELATHATDGTTGYRVLKKVVLSDDKVLLQVEGEGEKEPAEVFLMKRIGDEWKLSDQF